MRIPNNLRFWPLLYKTEGSCLKDVKRDVPSLHYLCLIWAVKAVIFLVQDPVNKTSPLIPGCQNAS
jgi:hypothetical protein